MACLTASMVARNLQMGQGLIYPMGCLVFVLLLFLYVHCRLVSMPHGAREVMLFDYSCIPTAFRSDKYFNIFPVPFCLIKACLFPLEP